MTSQIFLLLLSAYGLLLGLLILRVLLAVGRYQSQVNLQADMADFYAHNPRLFADFYKSWDHGSVKTVSPVRGGSAPACVRATLKAGAN